MRKRRRTTFAERGTIAAKAASLMRERIDELARLVTLEMGKLIAEARDEVELTAGVIDYYAENAQRFLAPEPLEPLSGEARIENAPLGVLLGIQVWNLPYHLLARFAAPNLMAGNVVMVKHAESVPQCAVAFEKLWLEAGAPAGAYTNLCISHDQVSRLIEDPRIKGVACTGSVAAGKSVAGQAGKHLKKTTMELGGSDAFIVLEDADLDKTVKWAVWAKMNNTGQSCVAGARYVVVEELADRFLEKFKAALSARTPGDPMDKVTTLAPVALMFQVKDEDEAVALAKDSDFGLGASIFTRDVARGQRLASRIDTGMVFINQPTWTAPELPFGGIMDSGYGRNLSSIKWCAGLN